MSSLTGSRVFLASSPSRANSLVSSALSAPRSLAARMAFSSWACATIDFSSSASKLADAVFPANIARIMSGAALAMPFNSSAALFILARSCSLVESAGCACAVEPIDPSENIEKELKHPRPSASADITTRLGDLYCQADLRPAFEFVSRAVSGIVITSV